MVSLTRIYTRGGDKGQTSLGDGSRVDKSSLRIEVLGNLDEANAAIGLAVVTIRQRERSYLEKVQHELFDLGAELCQPGAAPRISAGQIERLERGIDSMNQRLPPLDSFVLPGGSENAARLHQARTIVRRAERSVVELSRLEPVSDTALGYLNRLSDYLFVMARLHSQKRHETLWIPKQRSAVGLSRLEPVSNTALGYLNRLSDYLVVMVRPHSQKKQETLGISKLGGLLGRLRSRKQSLATDAHG